MFACAWKREENYYTIQIYDIKKGDKQQLKKLFNEWRQVSVGWNVNDNSEIYIYMKSFKDQKEWIKWAKECPISITEIKEKSKGTEQVQLNCKKKKRETK